DLLEAAEDSPRPAVWQGAGRDLRDDVGAAPTRLLQDVEGPHEVDVRRPSRPDLVCRGDVEVTTRCGLGHFSRSGYFLRLLELLHSEHGRSGGFEGGLSGGPERCTNCDQAEQAGPRREEQKVPRGRGPPRVVHTITKAHPAKSGGRIEQKRLEARTARSSLVEPSPRGKRTGRTAIRTLGGEAAQGRRESGLPSIELVLKDGDSVVCVKRLRAESDDEGPAVGHSPFLGRCEILI